MGAKTFKELYELDLKTYVGLIEKPYTDKNGQEQVLALSYIAWADALRIMFDLDPEAAYEIREWEGRPYLDTGRGALVHVTVTLFGRKRSCFLPIMDAKYNPIEEFDSFDVNTAIQRCIVKALAHHGVGLSLYKKDVGERAGAKHPPMKPGANGERVSVVATVLKVTPMKDASKGAKIDLVTEAGEGVKVTAWARRITALPTVGEGVLVSGVWEISDKYGASITADRITANVLPEHAEPEQPKPEPRLEHADAPPDTPANRASMVRKLNDLNARATACGVNPIDVKALVGKTTSDLMSLGLAQRAAVEAAETKKAPTSASAQADMGYPV